MIKTVKPRNKLNSKDPDPDEENYFILFFWKESACIVRYKESGTASAQKGPNFSKNSKAQNIWIGRCSIMKISIAFLSKQM